MKNTIRLIIAGYDIDMIDDVVFAITKEFKNMSNPTNIINDWSKTITIPFSANNNKVFGHIYDANRRAIKSSTAKNIGLFFDPSKKVDFKLLYNNDLLMEGYMKMSSIEKEKGYNVNLFGGLGKVFSELQKLTPVLTDTITEEKYLIDPTETGGFFINKDNVAKSWRNLRNAYTPNPLANFIGFAPINGGYNDDFESKSIWIYPKTTDDKGKFMEFKDIIEEKGSYEDTIYDVDSIVGDGLLPRLIADYRSYGTQPYLFVNKMFETLATKCSLLTDYKMVLDESWFNKENPYYYDSVMLLKRLEHNAQSQNTYAGYCGIRNDFRDYSERWGQSTLTDFKFLDVTLDPIDGIVKDGVITIERDNSIIVKYALKLTLRLQPDISSFGGLASGAQLYIHVRFVDPEDPNNVQDSEAYIFTKDNTTWYHSYDGTVGQSISRCEFWVSGEMSLKYFKFLNNAKMLVAWNWIPNSSGNVIDYGAMPSWIYLYPAMSYSSILNYEITSNDNRSNDFITFNDLWNNDITYFDQCLKYTKMFNLVWDVNEIDKTVTIMPMATYFKNEKTILDWTDKVDFDSNYKLEPLIFDAKHYKLGYEDSEIGLGETYLKKYGSNYGDKIIDTTYNFNDETTNLIEDLKAPIINTTNIFSWPDMYNGKVVYRQCKEQMLCLEDDDKKGVDGFGTFLFYRGLKYFDDLGRDVNLTDDNQEMLNAKNYSYLESLSYDSIYSLTVDRYPLLDVVYDGQGYKLGYYFGRPKAKYDVNTDYSTFNTIYDTCWKKYMNEYTSENNHKLTAYVYLNPVDYLNFKFNKMVKIGNQLYIVNKISDYSFGAKTKCEFIRVNDPANYRTNELPDEEIPTVTMLINNLSAADSTSDIWCTILTNIDNFNKDNVVLIYFMGDHGTLTLKGVNELGGGKYLIIYSQSGFTGTTEGFMLIVYYSKLLEKSIVLKSFDWKIAISEDDDPAISTTSGRFTTDSVSVADLTSDMVVTAITYSTGITQDNFEIEKKTGAGTLSVKSFIRTNNSPVITLITLSLTGFTSVGGSGNLIVRINDEIAARIPWHIIGKDTTIKDGLITGTKITGDKVIDNIYISADGKKLYDINEDSEFEESDSVITTIGTLNTLSDKIVLTYNTDDVDNVAVNINSNIRRNAESIGTSQAPGRYPVIGDLLVDMYPLLPVEDIVIR